MDEFNNVIIMGNRKYKYLSLKQKMLKINLVIKLHYRKKKGKINNKLLK